MYVRLIIRRYALFQKDTTAPDERASVRSSSELASPTLSLSLSRWHSRLKISHDNEYSESESH